MVAKYHAEGIRQQNAGEVEQVKFQCTPYIFHGPAQREIANQSNGGEEDRTGIVGQGVGEKPPDLPLEDQLPVKAKPLVENIGFGKHAHQIHDGAADGDIQHQIGDAFVAMAKEKPGHPVGTFGQKTQLLKLVFLIITGKRENVHKGIVNRVTFSYTDQEYLGKSIAKGEEICYTMVRNENGGLL